MRRLYAPFLKPGDIAFDVGGHVGNRTRALRALGARVVVLEPQSLFYRFLTSTLPRDGVIVLPEAVGAKSGSAVLKISSRHPTVSSIAEKWIERVAESRGFRGVNWDRQQVVSVTTLDRLIEQYGVPRFCKIDVEGMEADVLAGLSHAIPAVSFEYVPGSLDTADQCIDLLGVLGPYRFNIAVGEECRFRSDEWLSAPEIRPILQRHVAKGGSGDLYAWLEAPS